MPRKTRSTTTPEQTNATPAQVQASTQNQGRRAVTGKGDHDADNPVSNATGEYLDLGASAEQ